MIVELADNHARHVWLQHLPPDQVPACGPGLSFMLEMTPSWESGLVVNGICSLMPCRRRPTSTAASACPASCTIVTTFRARRHGVPPTRTTSSATPPAMRVITAGVWACSSSEPAGEVPVAAAARKADRASPDGPPSAK